MPLRKNISNCSSSGGEALLPDVKLSDFANSDLSLRSGECGRISKNSRVLIRSQKNWWECEDDDYEDLFGSDTDEDRQTESSNAKAPSLQQIVADVSSFPRTRKKRKFRSIRQGDDNERDDSSKYPQDLWFLISKYIDPEDIWRFASICSSTHKVVSSIAFWKNLYKRFYCPWVDLPAQLKPEVAVSRTYGLRTSVIKSLFYLYEPFRKKLRIHGLQLSSAAVGKLGRGVCSCFWHEQSVAQNKTVWIFYFKFAPSDTSYAVVRNSAYKRFFTRNRLDCLDDMWANLEEGCCILKATLTQFSNVPPRILGFRLTEISLPLSSNLRAYRLRLCFQSFVRRLPNSNRACREEPLGTVTNLVLEGVQSVTLLDWWHPEYPLAVL